MVLPSGEYEDMIIEKLPVYYENFTTIAVTVVPVMLQQYKHHNTVTKKQAQELE